jgi:hypothetical protein
MSCYLARMTPIICEICTILPSPKIRTFPASSAFPAALRLEAAGGEEKTRPVDALQGFGLVRVEPRRQSFPARILEKTRESL